MKDISDSARERNKNFGRRRGQWLYQVHDDPAMVGAPACVMYAVAPSELSNAGVSGNLSLGLSPTVLTLSRPRICTSPADRLQNVWHTR